MSPGSAAIPLLKAAPEAEQIADRLDGGPWAGLELCLGPEHVDGEEAMRRAIRACDGLAARGLALTAEAPVRWPSGAFVRVDRLDDEAREGIVRSAEFARAIGASVLTIHLFIPLDPAEFRDMGPIDDAAVARFLEFYAEACSGRGIAPLIENVPPVLRMRTGGMYLSQIGGHWRDLLAWGERVPRLGFTIDTSHAELFHSFAAAYPGLFGEGPAAELNVERYVAELGPRARVAHVSDARGLLGEGLPYGAGELELDPIVQRIGELVSYIVAEINEPDPRRAVEMKRAYGAIDSALAAARRPGAPPAATGAGGPDGTGGEAKRDRGARDPSSGAADHEAFDWQAVLGRRNPVPALLELEEQLGGRRILITGGGGSIAGAVATFLLGFSPERITLLDSHEPSLAADRRAREPRSLTRIEHLLADIRDGERLKRHLAERRPQFVFHFAAYKHVDWAEAFPEEFVATNLQGSWNVLEAAEAATVETMVVASTDKAALGASLYARTKRLMEALAARAAGRGGNRIAVRFVNVLGSAGSASELFLRQARASAPLTVTDSGMVRYWITAGHAACLAAHGALLAPSGVLLAAPADPVRLTVRELAARIWRRCGHGDEPQISSIGIRPGETMAEELTGPGEELASEIHQGIAPIHGGPDRAAAAWIAGRISGRDLERGGCATEPWLEALDRPELTPGTSRRPGTAGAEPVPPGRG